MRAALLSTLTVLAGAAMATADLPDVSALPARPALPDPLVTLQGERISTREQWNTGRRPELKKLFQHYMYGYFPAPPREVKASVSLEDRAFLDGKATLKELVLSWGPPGRHSVRVLLVVPNQRSGPAPVFVGLSFAGNHTLLADPRITITSAWMPARYPGVRDGKATEESRGTQVDVYAIDQAIQRGYAVATCYCGDIAPDRADSLEGSVREDYLKKGQSKPGRDEWGTIAAWAWGVQRIVDYLVTDRDLDARRIAVVGHSRLGKTALLAAAFDERIALSIPHQAGCGGTAPSRGKVGESVKAINDRFPHWFNDVFKEFNTQVDRLPFDQHCLAALVAPRPLLFSNAVEDTWANPDGQFEVLQAADPVYRLLGTSGLEAKEKPPVGVLSAGVLGYYIRPGKHSMTREDWKVFLDFADRHLGKPGK